MAAMARWGARLGMARISIRYYDVGRADRSHPPLAKALKAIHDLGDPDTRERDVGEMRVRLEKLSPYGTDGSFEGEFVRLQEEGYPSEVHPGKVEPLKTDKPLGHHVAFVYDNGRKVLAIEHDNKALALSRINTYFSKFPPNIMYILTPRLREDAWDRFQASPKTKFQISIARPEEIDASDRQANSLYESLGSLSKAYGPHLIEITMSMGQTRGHLDNIMDIARDLMKKSSDGELDIRKIRAKTERGGIDQADEINLLDEILNDVVHLKLPKNDPDASYNLRVSAIKDGLKRDAKRS
ncbi:MULTISPECIES: DUF6731 family protein [unclassified Chelatococcus]|uniref:DUF6731 family protein n=1 Tax=unclassified Chelatococcus TaxID=2638111 RepID=UPI001BCDB961|nr:MULTISPECIES: DUF6731 family protein [unclassified Chelatococcus]CAH1672517.1 hypothetical protein CHELA20_50932 [Hyphomicrobiales bacterium]MBS7738941.1 hypothetical protein [Chelatococcus sp. HY11]MBX3543374.1 hypothetical protein [Chelatococcus sp.]MCO5076530.1 hypothetical protein [Chelatococcus sp.]CAH1675246.1 hypothetical protein CHELA41_24080 [Hyphomicrobiales bacterium]